MSDYDPNINKNTPDVTLPDPPAETAAPPEPPVNQSAAESSADNIPANTAVDRANEPAAVPAASPAAAQANPPSDDPAPWPPVLEAPSFDPDQPGGYEHNYQPPSYTGNTNGYEPPSYGQPPNPYSQQPQQQYQAQYFQTPPPGYQQKSRLAAGILGILYGCFGVHNFYLGNTTKAVIQLVLSILGIITFVGVIITVGMYVWGFIEGIQIIIGKENYQYDANNVILRD